MKTEKTRNSERCLLFLAVFVFYAIAARYFAFAAGYMNQGIAVRTGQFLDLVHGHPNIRQSMVASLWYPPLPVIIRAPFALFPFPVNAVFLNNIISCLFGAGTVVLLDFFTGEYRWDNLSRRIILFLFVLNPVLLFIAVSGTDLSVFLCFFTGAAGFFLLWLRDGRLRHFLYMAFFVSMAAITVVEGVFYGLVFLVLTSAVLFAGRYDSSAREGYLLLFLAPGLYLFLAWALFNWFVFGDWLYFARGIPFHLGRLSFPAGFMSGAMSSLKDVFSYIYLIGAVSLLHGIARKRASLVLLVFFAAVVPFAVFFTDAGGDYSPVFALAPVIPLGFFMILEYASGISPVKEGRMKQARWLLLAALLFSTMALSPAGIIAGEIAGQGRGLVPAALNQYLNDTFPERRVIVTGYQGYSVIHREGREGNILHVFDFYADNLYAEREPSLLLVSRPSSGRDMDMVFNRYGGLFNAGEDFTLFEREISSWRIYRLILLK